MGDVVMIAPPDSGGATVEGVSYTVSRGKIKAAVEHVATLQDHGFTVAEGQDAIDIPAPAPVSAPVTPPPAVSNTAVQ